ncbi:MAG: hypothetical protein DWQ04_27150 [Chloroflexi bacterium]|nr:MAG: hypothetical protein DWQ04_27150 [Chloroflexota bacterium]
MKSKLLGFGSFFFPAFIVFIIITVMLMPMYVDMEGEIPVPLRPYVVGSLILLFLSVIGLWFFIIYDIVHAVRNPNLSTKTKICWICAIWFLNIFVIPIYWTKHLRQVSLR